MPSLPGRPFKKKKWKDRIIQDYSLQSGGTRTSMWDRGQKIKLSEIWKRNSYCWSRFNPFSAVYDCRILLKQAQGRVTHIRQGHLCVLTSASLLACQVPRHTSHKGNWETPIWLVSLWNQELDGSTAGERLKKIGRLQRKTGVLECWQIWLMRHCIKKRTSRTLCGPLLSTWCVSLRKIPQGCRSKQPFYVLWRLTEPSDPVSK